MITKIWSGTVIHVVYHICNYGNGRIKFSKVQAERDDLIVQWAAIDYHISLVNRINLVMA